MYVVYYCGSLAWYNQMVVDGIENDFTELPNESWWLIPGTWKE